MQPEADVARDPDGLAAGSVKGRGSDHRWLPGLVVVVLPVLAELIVGGIRIGGPSLWRDEAATISGSQRSTSAIVAMMANQDAVHGPYYLLMHPVIALGGISATTLRLPSLVAMAIATGLTAALGRRLATASGLPAPQATGLTAGLLLVAVPLTTRYAQEARPYALTTLFAVLTTYALVRAADARWRRWWVVYAAALLLTGLFNLFALLIVAAHGVSLMATRDTDGGTVTVFRRWLTACAAVAVLLGPVLVLSVGQSAQLNWVSAPGLSAVATLARDFAGATLLVPLVAAVALLGCLAGNGVRSRGGLTLTWIALPWLVLPPVALMAVSLVHPVYVERYVLFCLPALAMLTSAGLIWLAVLARRAVAGRGLGRRSADALALTPSVALAVLIVLALAGPQRQIRLATARPDNLRAFSAVVARHELPGDAILYLPWDTEIAGVAYPAPFRLLRDIGAGVTPVGSATLRGLPARPDVMAARLRGVTRVWAVRWAHPLSAGSAAPASLNRLLNQMRVIRRWRIQSLVITLYAS